MLFDKSNICQSSVVLKKFLKIPEADSHNSFKVMYNWKPSEVFTNLCKMTSLSLWNLPHGGFIKFSAISDNGISKNKKDLCQCKCIQQLAVEALSCSVPNNALCLIMPEVSHMCCHFMGCKLTFFLSNA